MSTSDLSTRASVRLTPDQRLAAWINKRNPPPTLEKRPLEYRITKKLQIALQWATNKVWLLADGSFIRDDTRDVIGYLTKAA